VERSIAVCQVFPTDSEIIVEDFREVRLREFYIDHPEVIRVAKNALAEGRVLLTTTPRCSLVLATTASELCVREALLRPILHGSFHSRSSGDLMAAIIVTERNERLTRALLPIFARHTGIDLRTFNRSGSATPLGKEMSEIQTIRNTILHQGHSATYEEADKAIKIADCLLDDIFQRVIEKIGLHLHDDTVCGGRECLLGGE